MSEGWVVALSMTTASGDAQQLYPAWAAAGTAIASATTGQQIRRTMEGCLLALQVQADGTNAGTLELYDIDGVGLGIDTSAATAITDTQLDTAIAAGNAKLILEQSFAGSGLTPWAPVGPRGFMKGLAARVVGSAGTCKLNLDVRGGYRYTTKG